MNTPILSLRSIEARNSISYPNMDIYRGKATFIQGESGSGKSTLFQICNNTLSPTKGELLYNNKNINEQDPLKIRREILVASQKVFLFPESIEENFLKFYEYREEKPLSSEKMEEYLGLCRISKPLNTPCPDLSGGEKQRVFISICLSFMPKILLLDEPTSALDEDNAEILIKNLSDFTKRNDIALIVISHSTQLLHFADQIIHLTQAK